MTLRGENHRQPARLVPLTLPLFEAKWQLDGREADGVTGFAWRDGCLPASERSVWTRSVSDEVSTPDSAVKHGEPKWFY